MSKKKRTDKWQERKMKSHRYQVFVGGEFVGSVMAMDTEEARARAKKLSGVGKKAFTLEDKGPLYGKGVWSHD